MNSTEQHHLAKVSQDYICYKAMGWLFFFLYIILDNLTCSKNTTIFQTLKQYFKYLKIPTLLCGRKTWISVEVKSASQEDAQLLQA